MKAKTKKNLVIYGSFFGILLAMLAAMFAAVWGARPSWKKGLAAEIQGVLEKSGGDVRVGRFVELDSMISTSSALYELNGKDAGGRLALVVRVPSLVGPVPAVFTCARDGSGVSFEGYVGDFGRTVPVLSSRISRGIMNYWISLVPRIVSRAKIPAEGDL